MIAVIADDFTGAAEMAGVALRHGIRPVLSTEFDPHQGFDVVIVATNMRAKPEGDAMNELSSLIRQVGSLQAEYVFLKMDSVLRGHVKATLLAALDGFQKQIALCCPANPSLDRTIRNGIYYYHGQALMQSGFFPEASVSASSHVVDLLGCEHTNPFKVANSSDPLPAKGIVIGNTSSVDDLDQWAKKATTDIVLAGGADFFAALLRRNFQDQSTAPSFEHRKQGRSTEPKHNSLSVYICGSQNPPSRQAVQAAATQGVAVQFMPATLFTAGHYDRDMHDWTQGVVRQMERHGTAIAAIDSLDMPVDDKLPERIEAAFSLLCHKLMDKLPLQELIIEGGATAYAIIQALGYTSFYPIQELATGVVRTSVDKHPDLHLTVKPGSYSWPSSLWQWTSKS